MSSYFVFPKERIDIVEDCGETKGEVSVVLEVREAIVSGRAGAYSEPYAPLPGWNNRVRICAVISILGSIWYSVDVYFPAGTRKSREVDRVLVKLSIPAPSAGHIIKVMKVM